MNILTPKEKAKELVDSFRSDSRLRSSGFLVSNEIHSTYHAKRCALNCVNEIHKYRRQVEQEYDEDFYHVYGQEEYYEDVIEEIKKI